MGAAAWESKRGWKHLINVGPINQFIVYRAELLGLWMATIIGLRGGSTVRKLTVFIDNQAAIQSTERPRNQSRQMILGIIHRNIKMLTDRGVVVTLRWIPVYTGVKGNEEVDLLAKLATGWKPKKDPIPTFTTSQYTWIL